MIINVEKLPECKALLRIEVAEKDAKRERKEIVGLYAAQAKIPGFRPGKTPSSIIEKRFKLGIESELEERTVKKAVQKATETEKLDIIRVIEVRDQNHNPDGTYTATIELVTAPEFSLPEYKDIEVQVPSTEITAEQLTEALDQIRERFAEYTDIEDRTAAMNDFAVIDYKGSINGKTVGEVLPSAPATLAQNSGFWLRMAEDSFLPGFCADLVGVKTEDTRDITVTIPDDYPAEELRGHTINYAVEVNGLKEQVLPELNDEFANKVESGKSLEQLKEALRSQMEQQREGYRKEIITNQVLDKINSNLDFDLPKEIVMRETQSRVNDIVNSNSERGIPEEEIVENQQQIIQTAGEQANLSVKTSFILEQIADAEDIKVSREELLGRVAEIAARNKTPVKKLTKQLEKQNGFGRIYNGLRIQKTLDFLRDSASITEVDPEDAQE
ncbi:MAG: trigger factor [Verrucomicrobiaceae bacterium]|nr:trigger factor [Verrucomicrobiaceae bacterium]